MVESPAVVDGSELRSAAATQAQGGGDSYQISFALKPTGAQKFGAWTGAHINDYMGIVLNDEVKSIAYIKSQISDQGEISGRFTKESADDLALTLRSGALPAKLSFTLGMRTPASIASYICSARKSLTSSTTSA